MDVLDFLISATFDCVVKKLEFFFLSRQTTPLISNGRRVEVNFNIWRERPSTCRVQALRRYEEQTNLFIKSISGRRHLDSGRSILNLSWNYLLCERVLGLRGSSKQSELREQFTVFHFAYLCSWKMFFCYWSKAIGPMQGTPGTFFFYSCKTTCSLFL